MGLGSQNPELADLQPMGTAVSQRSGLSVRICQKPELTPGFPGDSDKEQEVCLAHSVEAAGIGGVSQWSKKPALRGGLLRTWGGGG